MPGRNKALFALMIAIIAAISVIAAGCGEKNTGRAAEKSASGFESGEADTVRHNGDKNGAAAGAAVNPEAVEVNADWYTANPGAADFTISTADELAALAHIVNGTARGVSQDDFSGKTIVLAGNIDLSAYDNWVPVGKNGRPGGRDVFRGTFDGGGHVVKNLTINRREVFQGLFGAIRNGTVKNLGVENVNISAWTYVGGIAGYINDSGSISNCHTTGKVSGIGEIGGIAGYINNKSAITNSYSTATVSGSGDYVGGLAGVVDSSFISNSYFAGSVSNDSYDGLGTGGLAGSITGYKSVITGCYSTGAVIGVAHSVFSIGGLTGHVDNGSRISGCAALGPKVTGGRRRSIDRYYRGLGRVAGTFAGHTKLSNNAAWAGMKNTGGEVDWAGEDEAEAMKNGADITVDDIRADPTMGGRFTAKNGWTIRKGKLPGLFGKAVEIPAYLNATVYGISSLNNALVSLGAMHEFTATVWGAKDVDKSVKWTITGNKSDSTVIDGDGLLVIGMDETAKSITVTATSAANTGLSAAAKVKIDTSLCAGWYANTRWYADNLEADSFTISTANELAGLAQIVNGTWGGKLGKENFGGKTIRLAGDISLSAYKNWTPIGNYAIDRKNVFSGTFDGGGHVISRLTVDSPEDTSYCEWCGHDRAGYQGLFGYIRGGSVENLGLDGVNVRGGEYVGGIAGVITGHSRIANSYSSGKVVGVRHPVGGVAGWVDDHSSIANSYSSGIVHSCHGTGGVAGDVSKNSSVANCYSTAEIINSSETGNSGGVAGTISGNSVVTNCYFAGKNSCSLYGVAGGVVGGAAGNSKITNCAALNQDLVCQGDAVGNRIVGCRNIYEDNYRDPILSNNAAYAGMKISYGHGSEYGANKRDGADITAARIKADGTLGGRFTPENGWTTENGKLPGLRGKAMELPRHLR